MGLKIGIVGLPNVGKSTLFNALTRTKSAQAENYPFCTIEPNVGVVEVPDPRIHKLAELSNSEKKIPAVIEFVDIAGLVKGASQGEGLGNKFLANIRECDAIGHVIRHFPDKNVTHVHDNSDPKYDREVIESELLLADLQSLEKRLDKARSDAKSGEKEKKLYLDLLERLVAHLQEGNLASQIQFEEEEQKLLKDLQLLTSKPNLYIANMHEEEIVGVQNGALADKLGIDDPEIIIPISAKIEEELSEFSPGEAADYLKSLGLLDTGLNALIRSAYNRLNLITDFTTGPKETRAWTINRGDLAPTAAGKIHTDFEKGFIKADVVHSDHFIESGSEQAAREKGLIRSEGKEYQVEDGDVIHFKFST